MPETCLLFTQDDAFDANTAQFKPAHQLTGPETAIPKHQGQ
jgi:hypothetical protein